MFELGSGMTEKSHQLPTLKVSTAEELSQADRQQWWRQEWGHLTWTKRGIHEDSLEEVMPELSPEDKREMGWQGREAQLRKRGSGIG